MNPELLQALMKLRSGGFPAGGMGGLPGMPPPMAQPVRSPAGASPAPGGPPPQLLQMLAGKFGTRPQGPMPGKRPMLGSAPQRPGASFEGVKPVMGRPPARPRQQRPVSAGGGTVAGALGR